MVDSTLHKYYSGLETIDETAENSDLISSFALHVFIAALLRGKLFCSETWIAKQFAFTTTMNRVFDFW